MSRGEEKNLDEIVKQILVKVENTNTNRPTNGELAIMIKNIQDSLQGINIEMKSGFNVLNKKIDETHAIAISNNEWILANKKDVERIVPYGEVLAQIKEERNDNRQHIRRVFWEVVKTFLIAILASLGGIIGFANLVGSLKN